MFDFLKRLTNSKPKPVARARTDQRNSVAIQLSEKQVASIQGELSATKDIFKRKLTEHGLVKTEFIDYITKEFVTQSVGCRPVYSKKLTSDPPILSLNEKKSLGLNPRAKYTASLIDCFFVDRIRGICPKDYLDSLYVKCRAESHNAHEIERFKEIGVESVRIELIKETCCKHAKKLVGKYKIEAAPKIPCEECDSRRCHCTYFPIIK